MSFRLLDVPGRRAPWATARRFRLLLGLVALGTGLLATTEQAKGQTPASIPPQDHFDRYGQMEKMTSPLGLDLLVWKYRGNPQGGPDQVLLCVRSSTVLRRPLKLRITWIRWDLWNQATDGELPPLEITLPRGSGGPRGKYHVVPLMFPGPVSMVLMTVACGGRRDMVWFHGGNTSVSSLLRVTPDWEEMKRYDHHTEPADVVHPLALPQRWPLLACYSAVGIDLPVLEDLQRQRPRAFEALRNWVFGGGQLLVRTEIPHNSQLANKLLRRVALQLHRGAPPVFRPEGKASVQVKSVYLPGADHGLSATEDADVARPLESVNAPLPPRLLEELNVVRNRAQQLERTKLPAARVGAGLVVLIPRDLWHPWEVALAVRVPSSFSAPDSGGAPSNALGMFGSSDKGLRIPGLGNPPVFVFLTLISIFVVAVGPLNYFWFRRRRSLHRLLVTVPGTAVLATAALLGYVFWNEGLDHKGRFLSFTYLDPVAGKAVTWAKGTYFTALPPRQGLRFPWDTAVFLIPPSERTGGFWGGPRVEYHWDAHRQIFFSGWLQPRQFTQGFLARVSNTGRKLLFTDGDPPQVANRLGTAVRFLLAKDSQGRLWWTENLASGQVAALRSRPPAKRIKAELVSRIAPVLIPENSTIRPEDLLLLEEPVEFMPQQYPNALLWQLNRVLGWLNRQALDMPSGQWVAVLEDNPELPTGMRLNQRESFHLIVGPWP